MTTMRIVAEEVNYYSLKNLMKIIEMNKNTVKHAFEGYGLGSEKLNSQIGNIEAGIKGLERIIKEEEKKK